MREDWEDWDMEAWNRHAEGYCDSMAAPTTRAKALAYLAMPEFKNRHDGFLIRAVRAKFGLGRNWALGVVQEFRRASDSWMERLDIGLQCPSCGGRGMKRVGRRLYRCERAECPGKGDCRMLFVKDGTAVTLPLSTGIALEETCQAWSDCHGCANKLIREWLIEISSPRARLPLEFCGAECLRRWLETHEHPAKVEILRNLDMVRRRGA